jgi:hypothetical protein
MNIQNQKTLARVQEEFSEMFPFLKIEFYKAKHTAGEGSPVTEQLDTTQTVGDSRTVDAEGDVEITPEMKVVELEGLFQTQYGLNVQVFRRSGDIWLQTTATDSWALSEQNRKGERSTQGL